MGHSINGVSAQDVAPLIDGVAGGERSAGEINRAELAPTQEKGMAYIVGDVPSDNVAASVDAGRPGTGGARDVN
jgi:hypothetical protein